MFSYNCEGVHKHLHTIAEMIDDYAPHLLLLQETKLHKHQEDTVANKLGVERKFYLNSNDQYVDDFAERLEVTSGNETHGTGIIVNTERLGDDFKIYEPQTARIQHLRTQNINIINVYLPTLDTTQEGKQKLMGALSDLDLILAPLKGEPVAVIGDFNLSISHYPWRQKQFANFFERNNLKLYSPATPTNFPRAENQKPAVLDHLACTEDFKNVRSDPIDRDRIPLNVSTHIPVLWKFEIKLEKSEKRKKKERRSSTQRGSLNLTGGRELIRSSGEDWREFMFRWRRSTPETSALLGGRRQWK